MNRRKLLQGIGATAIAAGICGCNSEEKTSSTKPEAKSSKTNGGLPQTCQNSDLDQPTLTLDASIMMVILLATTQAALSDCHHLADDFFPPDGSQPKVDPVQAKTKWGFDPTPFIQKISAANTAKTPQQIHDAFVTVHNLFKAATSYSGPDCPGSKSIFELVTAGISLKIPNNF